MTTTTTTYYNCTLLYHYNTSSEHINITSPCKQIYYLFFYIFPQNQNRTQKTIIERAPEIEMGGDF